MPYLLQVPTRREPLNRTPWTLWNRVGIDVGQTLIKESGTWRVVVTATDERLQAAEAYYIGGYDHVVPDLIAADLAADGFEDYLTPI